MNHKKKSWGDKASVAVATGLYLSYIPVWLTKGARYADEKRWTGAGFIGTLLGWASLYALPEGRWPLAAVLVVGTAVASAICGRAQTVLGNHDDSRIILDETIGFWAAAAWLPREPRLLLSAFILFRILDAIKLPPYGWLERIPGGAGVVLDDVGAGIVTNLLLRGICVLLPGWLI